MLLFRIKTSWLCEDKGSGALKKTKSEELVEAINYTEAEKVANAIAEKEQRFVFEMDIAIQRVDNVNAILYQPVLEKDEKLLEGFVNTYFSAEEDSEIGLYSVKVNATEIDANFKEKETSRIIFIPATSNGEASKLAKLYAKKVLGIPDARVKDVKFDRCSAMLLTPGTYEKITKEEIVLE